MILFWGVDIFPGEVRFLASIQYYNRSKIGIEFPLLLSVGILIHTGAYRHLISTICSNVLRCDLVGEIPSECTHVRTANTTVVLLVVLVVQL